MDRGRYNRKADTDPPGTTYDVWILEGGFSKTWRERLEHADTLICLDVPLLTRYWRVLRRTLKYRGTTRPDLPQGWAEPSNGRTLEYRKWIWNTRKSGQPMMRELFDDVPEGKSAVRLRAFREVDAFLSQASSK